ncbi:hypothetical protein GY45DRAFT_1356434 [Cubamyces sp. BRFM 1775]|nr:hypothetical protein GY45DRAFT_1356434 [Cubamyces sp. BRFM 1775]
MKRYCPTGFQYAVIRMDAMGMVEHFNDPIATAEAQALVTKISTIPCCCLYEVSPVGTTLRPEDPSHGITADMAIPIFPNTQHPRSRPPIQPKTPFPFPNCYHWIENDTTVRVRRKDEQYDDTNAVELSAMQHVMIDIGFSDDYKRMDEFLDVTAATIPSPASTPPRPVSRTSQPSRFSVQSDGAVTGRSEDADSLPEGEIAGDDPSHSPHDEDHCDHTVTDIFRMDIFGLMHDDSAELLPLVDLWYELTEHLSADTIPSPLEFYKERDAIIRIIRAARWRSPNVPTPLRNPDRLSIISDDLFQASVYSFGHPPPAPANVNKNPDSSGGALHESSHPLQQDASGGCVAHLAQLLHPASHIGLQRPASVGVWMRIQEHALTFTRRPPWATRPPLLPYFP